MRSPVYRNLDQPMRILGFSPMELSVLCVAFVALGEAAQAIGVYRFWAVLLTAVAAGILYSFRRSMGEMFARRLLRFLRLPSELHSKLYASGHSSAEAP
jgi:hypothetical protein